MTAAQQTTAGPARAFHVMTKPIGPICNLDCKYCFYLEKEKLFPSNENFKMSDEVLETYVGQYIEGQNVPEVSFAWQGGEVVRGRGALACSWWEHTPGLQSGG